MSTLAEHDKRTGEVLLTMGTITQSQLDATYRQQQALLLQGQRVPLAEMLLRNRFICRADAEHAVRKASGGARSGAFRRLLPLEVSLRHQVWPAGIEHSEQGDTLTVQTARPLTVREKELLRTACVEPVKHVRGIPVPKAQLLATLPRQRPLSLAAAIDKSRTMELSGPLLREVSDVLLAEAIANRASDIRLNRMPDPDSMVRYRIVCARRSRAATPGAMADPGAVVRRRMRPSLASSGGAAAPQCGWQAAWASGRVRP